MTETGVEPKQEAGAHRQMQAPGHVLVYWCFGQSAEWSIETAIAGGR